MAQELARAKVNLCLHVTGRRADGMHLLDSIVVFPDVGDVLKAETADKLSLAIDGPFGANLDAGTDNLVIRTAQMLSSKGAKLNLHKNLPVAAGIGGGSADAAACIRLFSKIWDMDTPPLDRLVELGADVPVCLMQVPVQMSGFGDILTPLPPLPRFWIVLVNSGQGVETSAVFKAMKSRDNATISNLPDSFPTPKVLFDFLRAQRNDMQASAINICPEITDVLKALEFTTNCELARMSGSGGTCFGLYETEEDALAASLEIRASHQDWWVVSAKV